MCLCIHTSIYITYKEIYASPPFVIYLWVYNAHIMKEYILLFFLLITYELLLEFVLGIEHSPDLTTSHFLNLLTTLLNI